MASACVQNAAAQLRAIEEIRRMKGGSQPHLMRCSDGHYYVVKFANNPQGPRILANELLGARLAALLGLPVAPGEVIFVPEELIRLSKELVIELARGQMECEAGLCFGSRFRVDPRKCPFWDLLPENFLRNVVNVNDFCGMLVFDLWTCNCDGRQVVFHQERNSKNYRATMIDQGFCFNGQDWNFPDAPLRGVYCRMVVYDRVTSMDDFEPWLTRLESEIDVNAIWRIAEVIPPNWYALDQSSLAHLVEWLDRRRGRVRELLFQTQGLKRQPFPNWITACHTNNRVGRYQFVMSLDSAVNTR